MEEPGLDLHEWESEMQALEDELETSPVEALPELDSLVRRMLRQTGYDISDPVAREGDEREIVAEYLAAHEIADARERDVEEISPGDVGAAINGFRAVFDYLVESRPTGEIERDTGEEPEP